jgi:hypothetical protein
MRKPLRSSTKDDDDAGDEAGTDGFTDGSRTARQRLITAAPTGHDLERKRARIPEDGRDAYCHTAINPGGGSYRARIPAFMAPGARDVKCAAPNHS